MSTIFYNNFHKFFFLLFKLFKLFKPIDNKTLSKISFKVLFIRFIALKFFSAYLRFNLYNTQVILIILMIRNFFSSLKRAEKKNSI